MEFAKYNNMTYCIGGVTDPSMLARLGAAECEGGRGQRPPGPGPTEAWCNIRWHFMSKFCGTFVPNLTARSLLHQAVRVSSDMSVKLSCADYSSR